MPSIESRLKIAVAALALVFTPAVFAAAQDAPASTAPTPAECGIPGHHALLERMTVAFNLTCDQEKKIEPLLHDEESVSKPLIAFQAFTPDEKKDVMQQVKLAARKQILPLLNSQQQARMNQEIDTVSHGGEGLQNGNHGGGHNKKADSAPVEPYQAEEALSNAISNYSAFSEDQKKSLVLKVKEAALRPDAPQMKPEQAKQVAAEVRKLSS